MGATYSVWIILALLFVSGIPPLPAKPLDESGGSFTETDILHLQSNGLTTLEGQKDGSEGSMITKRSYAHTNPIGPGTLKVYIQSARNLRDSDWWFNLPDPYVQVTVVNTDGKIIVMHTNKKQGTTNPDWNQVLDFGRGTFWPLLKIQIWDDDGARADDPLSTFDTFPIKSGYHRDLRHRAYRKGYLLFNYNMTVDENKCSSNPCLNGGTCTNGPSNYTCTCAPAYTGDLCETKLNYHGTLKVYARYARKLKDTDPWRWRNHPDPYVRVTAVDVNDTIYRNETTTKFETRYPVWNQWLNMGENIYQPFFKIQIWDSDSHFAGSDDAMSSLETVLLEPGYHRGLTHYAYGNGYLKYDYNLTVDSNESNADPCQNGCCPGYNGSNCEHSSGHLRIYARYGRNLPDADHWWRNSDPYIEFIGVDDEGNDVRRTTFAKVGTHNPSWNQWIDFGISNWKTFKMTVFDWDLDLDDSLSKQQTWLLSRGVFSSQRHNCYSGYVIFDYEFN